MSVEINTSRGSLLRGPTRCLPRWLLALCSLLASAQPSPAPVTVLPAATPVPKSAAKPKAAPAPASRLPLAAPPVSDAARLSANARGLWSGTVHFTVANGRTFDTSMTAKVDSELANVTVAVPGSGAETVFGRRAGNGVSWSSPGDNSVTEMTLQPAAKGLAQVTARVTRNGSVLATGTGVFSKKN